MSRPSTAKAIKPPPARPIRSPRKVRSGSATTKARIYVDYNGEEVNSGSINFASMIFNIAWKDNKILGVSTMEYSKCVKCLADTFDGGWRYAQKW